MSCVWLERNSELIFFCLVFFFCLNLAYCIVSSMEFRDKKLGRAKPQLGHLKVKSDERDLRRCIF